MPCSHYKPENLNDAFFDKKKNGEYKKYCKECLSKAQKKYQEDPEKKKEYNRNYHHQHKEEINKKQKIYHQENKEKHNEMCRNRYEENKEEINRIERERRKNDEEYRQHRLDIHKKSRDNNRCECGIEKRNCLKCSDDPIKIVAKRMIGHSRTEDKKRNRHNPETFITYEYCREMIEKQTNCIYCWKLMEINPSNIRNKLTIERMELSEGHSITNTLLCCKFCNSSRSARTSFTDYFILNLFNFQ